MIMNLTFFLSRILNEEDRNVNSERGNFCDKNDAPSQSIDWQGEGWYRIMDPAGTKIPEGRVTSQKCGTFSTGWLNGTHPNQLGEQIEAQVCFDIGIPDDGLCRYEKSIQIINCGAYYLYSLPDVSICESRYCTV